MNVVKRMSIVVKWTRTGFLEKLDSHNQAELVDILEKCNRIVNARKI